LSITHSYDISRVFPLFQLHRPAAALDFNVAILAGFTVTGFRDRQLYLAIFAIADQNITFFDFHSILLRIRLIFGPQIVKFREIPQTLNDNLPFSADRLFNIIPRSRDKPASGGSAGGKQKNKY
jgi:hypothetical protein